MSKTININQEILQRAIDTWGIAAQREMLQEECIELALSLQKLKRNRGNAQEKYNNVIDEIADVTIMLEQAKILFPIDKINERIDFKMTRLLERLEEGIS